MWCIGGRRLQKFLLVLELEDLRREGKEGGGETEKRKEIIIGDYIFKNK